MPTVQRDRLREEVGEMLALEFEQPAVFGAVHHITVNCNNIRHPDVFADEAVAWMKAAIRDIVEKGLSGPELLKRARGMSGGDFKVKYHGMRARVPAQARRSMTVADVRTDARRYTSKTSRPGQLRF